ncbi:MAG: hypothetical protein JW709_12955, partial [Sedimentisphaerales bacterium]|nr:hypothetical protein [Sedimentisphaerales bacterium]
MQSYLQTENHTPLKPAYKVIDAHNHLWGQGKPERIVQTMDKVGVVSLCDVTANARIAFAGGGYQLQPGDIEDFFSHYSDKYPGRFYCFTLAEFARPADKPLFRDAARFVADSIATLENHVRRGARGLKVLKELGLRYRDAS